MSEHLDVLVIGAGLSGVGAGCRLEQQCPDRTYAILEARDRIGGTWDLFRYPGIRSDSDMYSLGYSFRPWTGRKAIGDGADIRRYVEDTAKEFGVDRHIRFGHRAVDASWSSTEARWTVTAERDGETVELTSRVLYWCGGYYRYDRGFLPQFEGYEDFDGPIVHPQHWDEELDYTGKRVVVVGSGATAVTLIPSLARQAAHVTMLQRSPSYIFSYPAVDPLAKPLLKLLRDKWAYSILRWKNVAMTAGSWEVSRRWPWILREFLKLQMRVQLPRGYDMRHFTPNYEPWDQRICLVPNGDLFRAIRKGRASVVTDQIERFTRNGIRLRSGEELEADVIVTATGLIMEPVSGATVRVDGRELDLHDHTLYRGMILDDVPNLAIAMGYTNASFTLKCDLTSLYLCRLLNHMKAGGFETFVAPRPGDEVERVPPIDMTAGYVQRSLAKLPQQGAEAPWRLFQNYPRDIRLLTRQPLEDGVLEFRRTADREVEAAA